MALLDRADVLVIADTFQYSRQSLQNRALLRTPDGRQWISIPLRGRQHGLPILDVAIHGKRGWLRKHWRALHFNYRTTPYFEYYEEQLRPVFEREWSCLADLTVRSIELTCRLLGIQTRIVRASQLIAEDRRPDKPESVRDILGRMGRADLIVPEEAAAADLPIASKLLTFEEQERRQNFAGFEPGMSTLDLVFNYGPDASAMIRRGVRVLDVGEQSGPERGRSTRLPF